MTHLDWLYLTPTNRIAICDLLGLQRAISCCEFETMPAYARAVLVANGINLARISL